MRRIFSILILLGLVGGAIWYFGFRNKNTDNGSSGVSTTFKSFFPLGNKGSVDTDGGTDGDNINNPENETPRETSPFKQISRNPIAGYSIFSRTNTIVKENKTKETVIDNYIRYVSRQSGYVYEIKNDLTPLQISNIFIPAIYEAYFLDDKKSVILRFLKEDGRTIGSYTVPIPEENPDGTRTQKEGSFLLDNISSISVSPLEKEFVFLVSDTNQGTFSIADSLNKKKRELFRSPLKEWWVSWPKSDSVYIQTKPASIVDGFLYKIDVKEKRPRKILGGIKGLTTSVSPSGNLVIFSESTEGGFSTKLFNTKTLSTKSLGLSILPEKCVWLKNEDLVCAGSTPPEIATYPDSWYAGLVSFQDQIFRIYTQSNTFDVLNTGNRAFDITNLQVDENKNILYFINKKDGILWQFSL